MKKIFFSLFFTAIFLTVSGCSFGKEPNYDFSCEELAGTVLDSVEFPATIPVTDPEIILTDIGIDVDDCEDYYIAQQAISADLAEIVLVQAKDGEADKLLEALENRKENLINILAFYPNQVESASATVTGMEGNYVYLICHEDADIAEVELIDKIYS